MSTSDPGCPPTAPLPLPHIPRYNSTLVPGCSPSPPPTFSVLTPPQAPHTAPRHQLAPALNTSPHTVPDKMFLGSQYTDDGKTALDLINVNKYMLVLLHWKWWLYCTHNTTLNFKLHWTFLWITLLTGNIFRRVLFKSKHHSRRV